MCKTKVDNSPKPNIKKSSKYDFLSKRERLRVVQPGRILNEFYKLPHRNAYYAWTIAKEDAELTAALGRPVTLEEIEVAMFREGMLPAHEYGIPRWFCRKYGFK